MFYTVSVRAMGEARVAELKKLKTGSYMDRPVTGAEISSLGVSPTVNLSPYYGRFSRIMRWHV